MRHACVAFSAFCLLLTQALAAGPKFIQPKVSPGPNEPNWTDILKQQWDLDMDRDLRNPMMEDAVPACEFVKAGNGPVTFTPIIALGKEETTRGGWYALAPREKSGGVEDLPTFTPAWTYAYKQPEAEMKSGKFTLPKLASGSTTFDPGKAPFGLWISNDSFQNERVYTDPRLLTATNPRLKPQPYKARIYPNVDPKTHEPVPNSYIIGWEYSNNDDFQDVVTRIDNVRLLPPSTLPGVVKGEPMAKKLAGGFKFTEGPAWSTKHNALFFSDIPPAHIVRYKDGKADVANPQSNQSNGLMFDKAGALIACEGGSRRVSLAENPGDPAQTIIDRYQGKRLNSPNDLWLDEIGGVYFTDPCYGPRNKLELDKEAVYYIAADRGNLLPSSKVKITRVIDDLVRPNGIALSPDGKILYVVDNGTGLLYRYPILSPGKLGKSERIAFTVHPDGMCVDREGRLYVTGLEGVIVLMPDGKWIGVIAADEQPANCKFGGPGERTLFITARTGLYGIETQTRGWHVHTDGKAK